MSSKKRIKHKKTRRVSVTNGDIVRVSYFDPTLLDKVSDAFVAETGPSLFHCFGVVMGHTKNCVKIGCDIDVGNTEHFAFVIPIGTIQNIKKYGRFDDN